MEMRPGYREAPPPPSLRGAVACLWVRVVGPAGAPPTRVLPDACADIVWRAGHGAWVAGPDTGPVVVDSPPGTVLAGVRFAPGAAGPALGLPLSEIRDERVPVADVLADAGDALGGDLAPAAALRGLAAAAGAMVRARPPDPAARAAAVLLAAPGARVAAVATALGLSERQLLRRCRDAVGYGPKTLHRVLRLRRLLAALDAGGAEGDLARAAAEAGYADQPHLTRECRRLAGLSPAALARERAVPPPP